jgi:hypothetical protein
MLADSPDTTALFLDASVEPELSRPVDATEFQIEWAKEWVKQPMAMDRINRETLGLICNLQLYEIVSHECVRKTLRNYNGKIISTLLDEVEYDLWVISHLLDLGPVELHNGGTEYVGLIDFLVQKIMADEEDSLLNLKCLANLSKNEEIKILIKKHAKINKLYKKLTNMLKHEVI